MSHWFSISLINISITSSHVSLSGSRAANVKGHRGSCCVQAENAAFKWSNVSCGFSTNWMNRQQCVDQMAWNEAFSCEFLLAESFICSNRWPCRILQQKTNVTLQWWFHETRSGSIQFTLNKTAEFIHVPLCVALTGWLHTVLLFWPDLASFATVARN